MRITLVRPPSPRPNNWRPAILGDDAPLAAPQYLLQLATGADCLAIDINGVRELEALAPLLALALRVGKPRLGRPAGQRRQ